MMTKAELIKRLTAIAANPRLGPEEEHMAADRALVRFINDPEVTRLYDAIKKWYA